MGLLLLLLSLWLLSGVCAHEHAATAEGSRAGELAWLSRSAALPPVACCHPILRAVEQGLVLS